MPKIPLISLIIFLLAVIFTGSVKAIPPKPSFSLLGPIGPTKMYFNDDTGFRDVEITPWSIGNHALGGNYLYLVTSYNTHFCDTPTNLFTLTSETKIENCKLRQSASVTPTIYNQTMAQILQFLSTKPLWSRDYYGAFSGHLINVKNLGWQLYTINHGELLNNNYFSAIPDRCILAPDIGYGSLPCTDANHGLSYNAFIGMSAFPWNSANFYSNNFLTDRGPIVWPANGYVDNGKKATVLGIFHPSSIIKDGYLYVFYKDSSLGTVDGRRSGIKVARAPITDNGIDPLSFVTYFNGAFTDKALPAGFNSANIMSFFSQKGGRSMALFGNDTSLGHLPDVYSFSAAHLKGTNLYIGVAQDLYLGVTLRLSEDLVNWSPQVVIPGTEFNYYTGGGTPAFIKQPFMYPKFLSADGDSNTEVDPNDFYVIGTTDGTNPYNPSATAKIVDQVHLKISVPPVPTKLGDVNGDGSVNILDIGIVIDSYGKVGSFNPKADVNNDGEINILDIGIVIDNYGK